MLTVKAIFFNPATFGIPLTAMSFFTLRLVPTRINSYLLVSLSRSWTASDLLRTQRLRRPGTKGCETMFFVNALDNLQFRKSTCAISSPAQGRNAPWELAVLMSKE